MVKVLLSSTKAFNESSAGSFEDDDRDEKPAPRRLDAFKDQSALTRTIHQHMERIQAETHAVKALLGDVVPGTGTRWASTGSHMSGRLSMVQTPSSGRLRFAAQDFLSSAGDRRDERNVLSPGVSPRRRNDANAMRVSPLSRLTTDNEVTCSDRRSVESRASSWTPPDLARDSITSGFPRRAGNYLMLAWYWLQDKIWPDDTILETISIPGGPLIQKRRRRTKNGSPNLFANADTMKEEVRKAVEKPAYNVNNMYHKTGCCQRIARSPAFEYFTFLVIGFNTLWIAYDTDMNASAMLFLASYEFLIAENFFCCYFVTELTIRFMAFKRKRDAFVDSWFLFDWLLVVVMVVESWVVTGIFALMARSGGSTQGLSFDSSIFKLVRILRLVRIARIVRLLRAIPELLILVKGLAAAARSVILTLVLLLVIIYIFAIIFRQLTDGTSLGAEYFESVPAAMVSLLLRGTLPDMAEMATNIGTEHLALGVLFIIFILLGYLTVMNMLVGVLVEVVSCVSAVEKEEMSVHLVKSKLSQIFGRKEAWDGDGNNLISREEFQGLIVNREAALDLQEVGVDVMGLAELSDFIFRDNVELTFGQFCTLVLQFRGSNHTTVKDIVELRRFLVQELDALYERVSQMQDHFTAHIQPRKQRLTVGQRNVPSTVSGDKLMPCRPSPPSSDVFAEEPDAPADAITETADAPKKPMPPTSRPPPMLLRSNSSSLIHEEEV